ncbi:MAG: fumarate reductase/succinate dehydrogenase flavoprotein subunit [Chthonomonadales bacterium]|nr:fumarate reductase/succinate dehydrogenase flavoprotein subunit [Chthonomonadales bacterium]
MEPYETVKHDVLIIGAGGAGLRAAISVLEAGLDCGIVSKSLLGKAHTVMAEGGAAAALGNMHEPDDWRVHFRDTIVGGAYLNNHRMVEIFAHEAIDRVLELEEYGAVFDRTPEGLIAQRPFGGHTYRRLNHVGDRTGLELIRTLQDRAVSMGPTVHMEWTVTRLLTSDRGVVGAVAYDRSDGRIIVIQAKAVVLATGGWGRMYRYTSNSWESTGDGAAMALEAGADLIDMEMVQFHPTGMLWPPSMRGILVTEAVRGEGGILRNGTGERFMFKPEYMPERYQGKFADSPEEAARWLDDKQNNRRPPELLPRDEVARAIYKEVRAGRGTVHGGVHLDVTHRGAAYIRRKLPSMYEQFMALGSVDITAEPMEVYPTVHYTMGGIHVDADTCQTAVPGLFAAGECAGGLHGANRLGGNSLTDILVFGRRAGLSAVEAASERKHEPISESQVAAEVELLLAPLGRTQGEKPSVIASELQEIMQNNAMIERSHEGLTACLSKLQELKERAGRLSAAGDRRYNPGWHAARDLLFQLRLSEAIVRSALERKESRGAQWRSDYPATDPEWGKVNLTVALRGDELVVTRVPLPPMPEHLQAIMNEGKK